MDQVTMDKFIEMIKGDIMGVSVSKKEGKIFTSINFKYDKEKDIVSYDSSIYDDATKHNNANKGIISNVDEIVTLASKMGLENELVETVKRRLSKEKMYLSAKQKMISKLDILGLDKDQKAIVLRVIDQVSQLSEVVGMGNRVVLESGPDFSEHVRLADQTKWDSSNGALHLQLVQTVEDSSGTKHRNYPTLTFEELVGRILNSSVLKKESNKFNM